MAFVRVVEIRLSATSNEHEACGIALGDDSGTRRLPIVIGRAEFDAITRGLHNVQPERPQTHDLLINVLQSVGVTIEDVRIHDLQDSTFFACITLSINGERSVVDARPSDAIALAVRVKADIFVSKQVMDEASVPVQDDPDAIRPKIIAGEEEDEETALHNALKRAVEAEDYTEAARLRDALQELLEDGN